MSRSAARTTTSPTSPTSPEKATMTAFRRSAKIIVTAALALAAGAAPLLVPANAAADTPLVVDGFDRTVASGWGTASTGGAWGAMVGGSSTSVSNSEGKVSNILAGRSFRAYQTGVSAEDAEIRADFTLPTVTDFQYTIESRKQADGSSYIARLRIDTAGKANLEMLRASGSTLTFIKSAPLTIPLSAGLKLGVKLSTKGESPVVVQTKIWALSSAEPAWVLTTLDTDAKAVKVPGYAGITAYNGPGNSAIDLTTQAFSVTDVTPAPVTPDPTPTPTPGPSGTPTRRPPPRRRSASSTARTRSATRPTPPRAPRSTSPRRAATPAPAR